MKWIINGKTFEESDSAADNIVDNFDEDSFDEMLDECYEEINVCGSIFSPSYALRELDPTGYRCSMTDYADSLRSDIQSDLERMDDGEEVTMYGCDVEVIAEEEEEEDEEEI